MIDPEAAYIDEATEIAADVMIYPGAILEGACRIEAGAFIGAGVHLKDVHVGANARILSYSVLTQARVGAGSQVGPFAYLRPGTEVGERCRIGNFVEIKNSTIGDDSAAAHLAYIGDADVGSKVNYSCGAITANYDGVTKSRTVIKDNAFIGSNVNLIAPLEIGEWAYIAAGSTINKDMPADSFGIARARQEVKPDWGKDPRKNAKN
jgi:bifunctional UDP-N-acetylglucosamine pyrophosphorylase/glucosamine-1-phosphate N-acetyltransferase